MRIAEPQSLRERIAASPDAILVMVVLVIFMDMMIYGLLIPIFPQYAVWFGVDESVVGVIFGLYAAMLLVFSIPMGLLSDRVGRRPLIAGGMLLLALATALFGLSVTVLHLTIARTVQGISAAATWSAGLALIADTCDPARLGEKMGIALSSVGLGTVLGPVAGGLLFEYAGHTATFIIPAVLAGIIGLIVLAIPVCSTRRERPPLLPRGSLLPLAVCAVVTVAVSGTYGVIDPYLPVHLHAAFSAPPAMIGGIFAVLAVATIIAQPIAGRIYDRYGGSRYLIPGGLLLAGAAIFTAVQAETLLISGVTIFMLGIGLGSALVPVMPILAEIYRNHGSQGAAYGIYNTFYSMGLSVGPFAGALILGRWALTTIFHLLAAVIVVAGVLCWSAIGRSGWR